MATRILFLPTVAESGPWPTLTVLVPVRLGLQPNPDPAPEQSQCGTHPDSVGFRPLHSTPLHSRHGTAPIGWLFSLRSVPQSEADGDWLASARETAGFQFPFPRRRLETRQTRAGPGLAGDCGKLSRSGKPAEARPRQFSADSGKGFQTGEKCQVVCLRPFKPALTPPMAARWSDTAPMDGSEIKNRASVSLLTFRHCHGFSFR